MGRKGIFRGQERTQEKAQCGKQCCVEGMCAQRDAEEYRLVTKAGRGHRANGPVNLDLWSKCCTASEEFSSSSMARLVVLRGLTRGQLEGRLAEQPGPTTEILVAGVMLK